MMARVPTGPVANDPGQLRLHDPVQSGNRGLLVILGHHGLLDSRGGYPCEMANFSAMNTALGTSQ